MYTQYYRLNRKPFENTPDPDFLYLSENHREVLASLDYGINSAKGLILAMGDVGTGKTTLINALQKQLDPSYIILRITYPRLIFGQSTFTNVLEYFAKELGLSQKTATHQDLIADVTDKLEALAKTGRKAVLIVDEAHLLSEESLQDIRLLSNIENEKAKLIQILLIGQNELNATLQKESLKALTQRFNVIRKLMPLNPSETCDYINHRLTVAGGKTELFDKKALSLIFKRSSGVPRLINQICDSALLIGYAVEASSIGSGVVKEVINDMNAVYEKKAAESIPLLHRWRWFVTWGILLLFIIAVSEATFFHRSFLSGDRAPGKRSTEQAGAVKGNHLDPKPQVTEGMIGVARPSDRNLAAELDSQEGPAQEEKGEIVGVPTNTRSLEPSRDKGVPAHENNEVAASGMAPEKLKEGRATEPKGVNNEAFQGIEGGHLGGPSPDKQAEGEHESAGAKGYYRVKKGDSLFRIAARKDVYGDPLKWTSLYRLNLDTLSHMVIQEKLLHQELPEGLNLKFVTPQESMDNLMKIQGKQWVINVLSEKTLERVVPYAARLIRNGYHGYLSQTDINGDKWIRLRVGFFETAPKAVAVQKEIAALLQVDDAWVTRVGGEAEAYGGY